MKPTLCAVLAAGCLFVPAALSQSVHAFPFRADGDRLAFDAAAAAALAGARDALLVGAPIAAGASADLALRRVDVADETAIVYVDGFATDRKLGEGATLWAGRVVGDDASDVFLALSRYGSRGWVRTSDDVFHLLAEPGDGGDWSRSRSRFVSERALLAQSIVPSFECKANEIPSLRGGPSIAAPRGGPSAALPPAAAAGAPVLPLYRCEVALETDFQFFALFGSLPAAETYALSLMGAVSLRYREQVGTILTLPYLGLYTNANDPWHSAETGGDTFSMLFEFQAAWGSSPPVPAHVYHFVSGAPLGGGVAYLDVLCNPVDGFGVSADLQGVTPFPVSLGPLTWDFFVVAHELGHNFGSLHTHDFCPPLDECWNGPCTPGGGCTVGTIMSYCHTCGSGMLGVEPVFHPTCAQVMRAAVEASCLPLFAGISSQESLGNAKPGSGGTPSLSVEFAPAPNRVRFAASSAPAQSAGVVIVGDSTAFLPFLGGVLVPTIQLFFGMATDAAGGGTLEVATPISLPNGAVLSAQTWFLDGPGFAATNGVEFELILP